MSFIKALATVAMGFAAVKGVDKYKQMGGMAGLQDMMSKAGDSPAADSLGKLADQMGVPGGSDKVREMMSQLGTMGASSAAAGTAGLAGLMNSMRGAAETGTAQSVDMMSAIFGGTPAGEALEGQAKLMLRAMIQAAKADGDIDEAEKAAILDKLGDDISAEERAFVQEQLAAPLDVAGLAADVGPMMAEQVYATSLASVRIDSTAEVAYMNQLATALGLSEEARNRIHARMGLS